MANGVGIITKKNMYKVVQGYLAISDWISMLTICGIPLDLIIVSAHAQDHVSGAQVGRYSEVGECLLKHTFILTFWAETGMLSWWPYVASTAKKNVVFITYAFKKQRGSCKLGRARET